MHLPGPKMYKDPKNSAEHSDWTMQILIKVQGHRSSSPLMDCARSVEANANVFSAGRIVRCAMPLMDIKSLFSGQFLYMYKRGEGASWLDGCDSRGVAQGVKRHPTIHSGSQQQCPMERHSQAALEIAKKLAQLLDAQREDD
ncbi:hypothetical protein KIN20_027533 [Parelaphostrongylus tenuis]|uniref:Uncharacterized protein n=1 Tax=Parelaphostrongylus tenuis TaxID=148309 RepID=A0AAD5QZI6_PARTN|nr:hypothetical protein KIN20_027533 [Parelaphostrongylus tenuis]